MILTQNNKPTIIKVLIALTALFLVLFVVFYLKFVKSNNELTFLKNKEFDISFLNNNYSINESKFLDIITEHHHFDNLQSKGYNFTEILDTILKSYQAENNQLTEKISNKISQINSLEIKLKTTEDQSKVNDSLNFSLQNELKYQKNLLEILEQNSSEVSSSKLDTLTIKSPKGDNIFYFGQNNQTKPNGYGIGFYAEKGYYLGEWDGNLRHGKGKHFYKDGAIYEGFFENNKREGFGVYHFNKNEFYEGMWQNDLMHGEGKIIGKKSKTIEGVWKNGKLFSKK